MSKNLQPITKPKEMATIGNELYRDMFTLQVKPIPKDYALKLAKEMRDFYNDDSATPPRIRLSQFLRVKGISSHTFYNLKKRTEELEEAHKWAMMIMGERRELGMLFNGWNAAASIKILPRYCEEWNKQQKEEAKLKALAAMFTALILQQKGIITTEVYDSMWDDLEKMGYELKDINDLRKIQTATLPGKSSGELQKAEV